MSKGLCSFCAAFFPLTPKTAEVAVSFHSDVAALLESSRACKLCELIQRHWGLGRAAKRFPSAVRPETHHLLPVSARLQKVITKRGPGHILGWAILMIRLTVEPDNQMLADFFSISSAKDETRPTYSRVPGKSVTSQIMISVPYRLIHLSTTRTV
jgi:hypothetical protein